MLKCNAALALSNRRSMFYIFCIIMQNYIYMMYVI